MLFWDSWGFLVEDSKAQIETRIYLSKILKVYYKDREIGVFKYKPKNNDRLQLGGDILLLQAQLKKITQHIALTADNKNTIKTILVLLYFL